MDFDRFSIPREIAELLRAAMRLEVIDALDVYALAVRHGSDWGALRGEVMEYAFSNRHGPLGRAKHEELAKLNDAAAVAATGGR